VKNRFSLTRSIPKDVRKRVRRRCGFGCVICGDAIVTYEHFDPPFRNATKHSAEGITLLCGSHQLESSKGLLSRDTIAKANGKPLCLERGYAAHLLDLGDQRPRLTIGGSNVTNCGSGIAVDGHWMLRLREPESHSRRWRLSARFQSAGGVVACEIRDNEIILPATNFEIEQVARSILVRNEGTVVLELEFLPPSGISINQYRLPTSEGAVFVGRRSIPDPLTDTESMKSVLEFRHNSGGVQCFVDCTFIADIGLNLSLTGGTLVISNQSAYQ
jgi:hypothetical protein